MHISKRTAYHGLIAAIYLGIAVLVINSGNVSAGCAGDCMTCHSELSDSQEHKPLQTCIDCHDPADNNKGELSAGSLLKSEFNQKAAGCGNNCFECHDEWPKDGYHAPLDSCGKCHS